MEQRVSLVTLGVSDLATSRRFYEAGLRWRPLREPDGDIVFYQLPGLVLALYPVDELAADCRQAVGSGFGRLTLAHNTRSRDEADEVMRRVEAAGARVLKPLEDTFWGGYSGYFADPDGHTWEVAHNPFCTITPEGETRF